MLWGLALHFWERVGMFLLFGGAIASATSALVLYEVADVAQADLKSAQSKLEIETGNLNLQIAEEKTRTAKFAKEAAEARVEQERLSADNNALQNATRPRRLNFYGFIENPERVKKIYSDLAQFKGAIAFIQPVPDFEARLFANDIAQVLSGAGWEVKFVDERESHLSDLSFVEGLSIFTFDDGTTRDGMDPGTAIDLAVTEAEVLMNGTGTFGSFTYREILDTRQTQKPGYPFFDKPINAAFVRVGLKPFSAQYLDMQRRQMERQDHRMDKSLRDAFESGHKVFFSVPNQPAIEVKIGPSGEWEAVDPTQAHLMPKKKSPTLLFPNGIMLRSSPP